MPGSTHIPILALAAGLLLACTPVINQRGYLPDPLAEASIDIGTDTQTTIQKKLGDPSTRATFGGDVWYYITSVQKQIAFFDPTTESRSILAINFDKDGKATGMHHYGLKDGHVVAFASRETPTRGREITFLQQLLNATPGVPGVPAGGQQSPGRAPGPGPGGSGPY